MHISALADRFVKDPREVAKAGDIVRVKVMEVDVKRKRIALSMRLSDQAGQSPSGRTDRGKQGQSRRGERQDGAGRNTSLAQAFASARRER